MSKTMYNKYTTCYTSSLVIILNSEQRQWIVFAVYLVVKTHATLRKKYILYVKLKSDLYKYSVQGVLVLIAAMKSKPSAGVDEII